MSNDRAIQNPDTKIVRFLDVAEVSYNVPKKFAIIFVLFYCWYSLYTFFLLNSLSFSMVTVTRLFCLVESCSHYAAANAGLLSVYLATILYNHLQLFFDIERENRTREYKRIDDILTYLMTITRFSITYILASQDRKTLSLSH